MAGEPELTIADEEIIRAAMPENEWERLAPRSTWRAQVASPDGLSVLVLVGTFERDRSAGMFGSRPEDLPWDEENVQHVRLVVDRHRRALTFVPDSISGEEFFAVHLESLARERRLAEIKRRVGR